jgi:cytochrome c-type biogenesis protein
VNQIDSKWTRVFAAVTAHDVIARLHNSSGEFFMATQTMPKRKPVTFAVRFQVFLHALLFVLGMSTIIVFVFGGATTIFGRLLYDARDWITRIGGIVVIIFGLHTLGIIKIPFLNYDTRKQYSGGASFGSSYLMGIFFTAGWTPCIGVTLGAIMTMGLVQEQAYTAMILAAAYALGLGLPFLVMGLLIDRATNILRRLRKYIRAFEIVTGVFLILLGILLFSGQMTQFAAVASRSGLLVDTSGMETGEATIPIAFFAGLLSFLSPCVLPLVPAYLGYLGGRAVTQVADETTA